MSNNFATLIGRILNETFKSTRLWEVDFSINILKGICSQFRKAFLRKKLKIDQRNFQLFYDGVDKLIFIRKLSMLNNNIQTLYEIELLKNKGIFSKVQILKTTDLVKSNSKKKIDTESESNLKKSILSKCDDVYFIPEHFMIFYLKSLKNTCPEIMDLTINELERKLNIIPKSECTEMFKKMNFSFILFQESKRKKKIPLLKSQQNSKGSRQENLHLEKYERYKGKKDLDFDLACQSSKKFFNKLSLIFSKRINKCLYQLNTKTV